MSHTPVANSHTVPTTQPNHNPTTAESPQAPIQATMRTHHQGALLLAAAAALAALAVVPAVNGFLPPPAPAAVPSTRHAPLARGPNVRRQQQVRVCVCVCGCVYLRFVKHSRLRRVVMNRHPTHHHFSPAPAPPGPCCWRRRPARTPTIRATRARRTTAAVATAAAWGSAARWRGGRRGRGACVCVGGGGRKGKGNGSGGPSRRTLYILSIDRHRALTS